MEDENLLIFHEFKPLKIKFCKIPFNDDIFYNVCTVYLPKISESKFFIDTSSIKNLQNNSMNINILEFRFMEDQINLREKINVKIYNFYDQEIFINLDIVISNVNIFLDFDSSISFKSEIIFSVNTISKFFVKEFSQFYEKTVIYYDIDSFTVKTNIIFFDFNSFIPYREFYNKILFKDCNQISIVSVSKRNIDKSQFIFENYKDNLPIIFNKNC